MNQKAFNQERSVRQQPVDSLLNGFLLQRTLHSLDHLPVLSDEVAGRCRLHSVEVANPPIKVAPHWVRYAKNLHKLLGQRFPVLGDVDAQDDQAFVAVFLVDLL